MYRSGARIYYTGWSSFKTLVTKGLAYEFSNPKKVGLTASGLGLAERLYRESVRRDRIAAVEGIPTSGDFLFQHEPSVPCEEMADGIGTWNAQPSQKLSIRAKQTRYGPKDKSHASEQCVESHQNIPIIDLAENDVMMDGPREGGDVLTKSLHLGHNDLSIELHSDFDRATVAASISCPEAAVSDVVDLLSSDEEDTTPDEIHSVVDQSMQMESCSLSYFPHGTMEAMDVSDSRTDKTLQTTSSVIFQNGNISLSRPNIVECGSMEGADARIIDQIRDGSEPWQLDFASVRLPPLPERRSFSETYEIVLLIDAREQYSRSMGSRFSRTVNAEGSSGTALRSMMDQLRASGISVEERQLPVGDALWIARSKDGVDGTEWILDVVIERKSLSDLVASIKQSNRYNMQKYHLKCCGIRNLYYLIEGDVESWSNTTEYKMLRSAAATTEIAHKFKILRTDGVPSTFRLYKSLTKAIAMLYSTTASEREQRRSTHTASVSNDIGLPLTYSDFTNNCKWATKGSMTLRNMWGCMLCSVPGLGPESAQAILEAYPTPLALWRAYKDRIQNGGGIESARSMLVGLKGRGAARSVSADMSCKVFASLFEKKWLVTSVA